MVFILFPGTLYTPSLPNSWLAGRINFGKYQVIKVSLWLLWAGVILLSLSLCLQMLLSPSVVLTAVTDILFFIALLTMVTGIAGFLINIIPFDIDQLSTASGD